MEIFTTNRLTIRELTASDVPSLMEIFADPISTKYAPGTKTLEQVEALQQGIFSEYQQHGHSLWAVSNAKSDTFVGICGLIQQHIRGYVETELGYHFIPQFWGNGYATEAGNGCLEYGYNQLEKTKIVSFINPKNLPSIAVAQRLGMTKEIDLKANENSWDKALVVYAISRQAVEH